MASHLAKLVLADEKDMMWRLFDDKNLSEGDTVDLINWNTKEKFGEAILVKVGKGNGEIKRVRF